jgi:hypothetical protein
VVDVAAHGAGSKCTLDQEIALEGTQQRLGALLPFPWVV